MRGPLQHHINSAGPESYLIYYADELDRTSSCERRRFLAQRDSLCVFSLLFPFVTKCFSQRNYHARKMPATSLSQPSNFYTTHKHSAVIQSTPSLSQQPRPAANTPGTMGVPSRPQNTVAGWRARFVRWLNCVPIQHMDGQH
ncbi:hypothetical protein BDR05DRAFT_334100 [Suillus weaverae]|nr:hypothetical protein BDR05DRAFT_334100 [Suillus weaverae]